MVGGPAARCNEHENCPEADQLYSARDRPTFHALSEDPSLHDLPLLQTCPDHELQTAYAVTVPAPLNVTDACQPVAVFVPLPPVGKLLLLRVTEPVVLNPPPTAFGRGLAQFAVAVAVPPLPVVPDAPVAITVERADPVAPWAPAHLEPRSALGNLAGLGPGRALSAVGTL